MSTVFVYDRDGQKMEESINIVGLPVMKKVFAYDKEGNKTEEVEYGEDGSVLQKLIYSREYDRQGNWIEETISPESRMKENSEYSTVVTYRDISYYSS